jgi:hypothetical protein
MTGSREQLRRPIFWIVAAEHATSPILQTRRRSRRLPCIDDLTPQTQISYCLYACLSLELDTSGHLFGVERHQSSFRLHRSD